MDDSCKALKRNRITANPSATKILELLLSGMRAKRVFATAIPLHVVIFRTETLRKWRSTRRKPTQEKYQFMICSRAAGTTSPSKYLVITKVCRRWSASAFATELAFCRNSLFESSAKWQFLLTTLRRQRHVTISSFVRNLCRNEYAVGQIVESGPHRAPPDILRSRYRHSEFQRDSASVIIWRWELAQRRKVSCL